LGTLIFPGTLGRNIKVKVGQIFKEVHISLKGRLNYWGLVINLGLKKNSSPKKGALDIPILGRIKFFLCGVAGIIKG